MHEEDLGLRLGGPTNRFGAGVHREGDPVYRRSVALHLDAVERVVQAGQSLDFEEGAAPEVEFREVFHGVEYIRRSGSEKGGCLLVGLAAGDIGSAGRLAVGAADKKGPPGKEATIPGRPYGQAAREGYPPSKKELRWLVSASSQLIRT